MSNTPGRALSGDAPVLTCRSAAHSDTISVEVANRFATIDVVLKIVERCNLACPYCYFFFSGDDTYMRHPPTIPDKTIRDLIAFLRDAVLYQGINMVKIGLHGGEPLMMKKHVFRDMCARFRAELGGICRLIITMQTNGVLIDEEWIDIFAEQGVRIGVSMDGPERIHNLTRITKKGRGTYAETRRGWKLLLAAAAQGRINSPGMLCVVSPEHSGEEAFNHLALELKAEAVNFLLPDITHDSAEATPEFIAGCGQFMLDVYKAWNAAKGRCRVRFIYEASGPMLNDEACRRSALGKYDPLGLIVVSSDGEISPDDVLRGVDSRFRGTGITLTTHSLHDVLRSDAWAELDRAQQQPAAQCSECIWFNACRGGAPQHRYSKARGFDNPSVFCPVLKQFHGHVASSLISAGYPIEQVEQRLETKWTFSSEGEASRIEEKMFA